MVCFSVFTECWVNMWHINFVFFIYVYIFDCEITIFGLLLASILMCPSSGGPKINFIELKLIKCLICDSFSVIFLSLVTNIKTQKKTANGFQ